MSERPDKFSVVVGERRYHFPFADTLFEIDEDGLLIISPYAYSPGDRYRSVESTISELIDHLQLCGASTIDEREKITRRRANLTPTKEK